MNKKVIIGMSVILVLAVLFSVCKMDIDSVFSKSSSGGYIVGYTAGDSTSNQANTSGTVANSGHAVFVGGVNKRRNSYVGQFTELGYDGTTTPATITGVWDN